jgi:hypothetical protein
MLETPTVGKFLREDRFVVFEPPVEYLSLVYGCMALGGVGCLYGFTREDWFYQVFGGAVFLAGLWANLSLVRIRFDLKNRTYRRRQGPGLIPRLWQGSLDDIDAVVVISEPSVAQPGAVRYHMVMHWKQGRAPIMVLESALYFSGGVLQSGAGPMLQKANRFCVAARIPLYDNTAFPSKCPIPIF